MLLLSESQFGEPPLRRDRDLKDNREAYDRATDGDSFVLLWCGRLGLVVIGMLLGGGFA